MLQRQALDRRQVEEQAFGGTVPVQYSRRSFASAASGRRSFAASVKKWTSREPSPSTAEVTRPSKSGLNSRSLAARRSLARPVAELTFREPGFEVGLAGIGGLQEFQRGLAVEFSRAPASPQHVRMPVWLELQPQLAQRHSASTAGSGEQVALSVEPRDRHVDDARGRLRTSSRCANVRSGMPPSGRRSATGVHQQTSSCSGMPRSGPRSWSCGFELKIHTRQLHSTQGTQVRQPSLAR